MQGELVSNTFSILIYVYKFDIYINIKYWLYYTGQKIAIIE